MKCLTINGKRNFNFNGRKYYIQNVNNHDGNKYAISELDSKGFYHLLSSNIDWHLPTFKTIKDAQRYVADWDFTLEEF